MGAMGGGAMGGNELNPMGPESDMDAETDGFDATDAAVGGEEELGRGRRSMSEAKTGKAPSMAHIKKMCQDGKTVAEICKMHPDCDRTKLKQMVADCKKKLQEAAKPDYIDLDRDGDRKESMKKAAADKKKPSSVKAK
jgi:hypothetical protein